jgi:hypothetical protein
MKTDRLSECEEIMNDMKTARQSDPYVVLYLVYIFTAFG